MLNTFQVRLSPFCIETLYSSLFPPPRGGGPYIFFTQNHFNVPDANPDSFISPIVSLFIVSVL